MADPETRRFDEEIRDRPDRRAACAVIRRLRGAGHEAWLVGGCVRDELLGRSPKEFDVATSAPPDDVEALFPRTVPVGKSFGVIRVLDSVPHRGAVAEVVTEVATFRADDAYVDGRRPTGVRFTTAREDAERRDFTVNGLFMDPDTGDVTDFVGGRADLETRTLRAIGDPLQRFREDKLRMLRAIRFAATGPFEIHPATWDAIVAMAGEVTVVSWERIREEFTRILVSGRSAHGLRLLRASGLLRVLWPELAATEGVAQPPEFHPEGCVWTHTLLAMEHFDRSPPHELVQGLGILFHDVGKPPTFRVEDRIRFDGHARVGAEMTEAILRRMKYPNAVIERVVTLVDRHMAFTDIRKWREAKRRRFLTGELSAEQLEVHRLDCLAAHGRLDTFEWCRAERERMLSEPPPVPRLLSGEDLIAAGYRPGPQIGKVLALLDDERLEGRLATREDALAWVLRSHPPETAR